MQNVAWIHRVGSKGFKKLSIFHRSKYISLEIFFQVHEIFFNQTGQFLSFNFNGTPPPHL